MATLAAFALVNRVAAGCSGLDVPSAFTRFAFAYVPLGIGFQLGRHTVTGLMENGGGMINQLAAGFGVPLALPQAWARPETISAWSQFGATGGLWMAAAWGAAIAWFVARDLAQGTPSKAVKAFEPHLFLMCVSTYLVIAQLS